MNDPWAPGADPFDPAVAFARMIFRARKEFAEARQHTAAYASTLADMLVSDTARLLSDVLPSVGWVLLESGTIYPLGSQEVNTYWRVDAVRGFGDDTLGDLPIEEYCDRAGVDLGAVEAVMMGVGGNNLREAADLAGDEPFTFDDANLAVLKLWPKRG